MSAEVLRRAAAQMREEWTMRDLLIDGTFLAVADWLDDRAGDYEKNEAIWTESSKRYANRWDERRLTVAGNLEHHFRHALAVARTYLGESA